MLIAIKACFETTDVWSSNEELRRQLQLRLVKALKVLDLAEVKLKRKLELNFIGNDLFLINYRVEIDISQFKVTCRNVPVSSLILGKSLSRYVLLCVEQFVCIFIQ